MGSVRARAIFERALALAGEARETYLREACGAEADLLRQVRDRLRAADQAAPTAISRDEPTATAETPSGPTAARVPAERIGPYALLDRLGTGGMGEVWLAEQREPVRRRVALKIIRPGMDSANVIARFEAERQALALMDHPAIARVFDAGTTPRGRPYFAMEYVRGIPITAHCDRHRLTTRERLELLQRACEGVQHAHQKGVIHRDLKPSNVLVALEGDRAQPKVIDFGVAKATQQRLTEQTIHTELGVLIGTPEYMSPEQADLTAQDIDTRTDVYSLGVLLYELLTGTLPFEPRELRKEGFDGIRRRIREVDPPTPSTRLSTLGGERTAEAARARRTDPALLRRQLSGDLDWITMRALEKDRTRRYGSPAELAADIQRHLDHQPVLAGPPDAAYRARKFVRRHRLGVSFAAVLGVLLIGFAASMAVQARRIARERDRVQIAQAFGQQVERIAALGRYAHLAPLHDVRSERAVIAALMAAIERRMDAVGPAGAGPGHYALGSGELARGRPVEAREHLQAAWDAGNRQPEVAYALARTLGALYHEALQEAAGIADGAARSARRGQLQAEFLDPAAAFLRQVAEATGGSSSYAAALLAYYERRYEDALRLAGVVQQDTPWQYEAPQLVGRIHEELAEEAVRNGEYAVAAERYELAEAAHRAALAVGQSDPAVHVGLCSLMGSRMRAALVGEGEDVTPYFERGVAACAAALAADPGSADAHARLSALHEGMARYAGNRGVDPLGSLREAIAEGDAARVLAPRHRGANLALGNAWLELARAEEGTGRDPAEALNRALGAFERALEIGPDFHVYNRLGAVHRTRAVQAASRGEDPTPGFELAIAAYRKSIELGPGRAGPHNNIGIAYYRKAGYEAQRGEDPSGSLEQAIAAYRRALEINPSQMVALYNLARAHADQAYHARGRGEDPRALFREAAGAYSRAIEINPQSAYVSHFHNGRGAALNSLAVYEIETGDDPTETLATARRAFEAATLVNPRNDLALFNLSVTHVTQALYEVEVGTDPRPSARRALEAGRRTRELKPDDVDTYANDGQAHWIEARHALDRGADPRKAIEAGVVAFGKVLERNPKHVFAHHALARLRIVEGRRKMGRGEEPTAAFGEARELIDAGLALNADDADGYLAAAALHRWWAEWRASRGQPISDQVASGLKMTASCLAINPRHAEGLALRGDLLALRGAIETRPAAERTMAEARRALEQALSLNANLKRRYGPSLTRVKKSLEITG